jgi:nanoRNase/pAp phosphatase (c-di-AMP/oligoRNAs hydrolase)
VCPFHDGKTLNLQRIKSAISSPQVQQSLILCHQNADPDAIGSAFALQYLLQQLKPQLQTEIAAPSINKVTKQLLQEMGKDLSLTHNPDLGQADIIFIVDTNTWQQLHPWTSSLEDTQTAIFVIDHHPVHPKIKDNAYMFIVKDQYTSTCEIIFELLKQAKVTIPVQIAQLLFLGIAFDTKYFKIASASTFRTISELVEWGVQTQQALQSLAIPMDNSERIARLKAAQRLIILKITKWIVAYSQVNAFQSSTARALLGLGAHVAIVHGENKDGYSISMRSTANFHQQTGIHLGTDVAQPLGQALNGMGGGHSTAAGVNGPGKLDDFIEKCNTLIKKQITVGKSSRTNTG